MQGREWRFIQQIVGAAQGSQHCRDMDVLHSWHGMSNPWHEEAVGPSSPVEMKAHITTWPFNFGKCIQREWTSLKQHIAGCRPIPMGDHLHGYLQDPAKTLQDHLTASSDLTISQQMVSQKKHHYMWLCPRVSCALNVQGLFGVWQGTFFLRFYWIFPCVSLSPLPLHLHSSTLDWGIQGSRLQISLSPCWHFFSSWAEAWYREVFGWQKLNQLREVTAATPSALRWLGTTLHWLQHLPA